MDSKELQKRVDAEYSKTVPETPFLGKARSCRICRKMDDCECVKRAARSNKRYVVRIVVEETIGVIGGERLGEKWGQSLNLYARDLIEETLDLRIEQAVQSIKSKVNELIRKELT